MSQKLKALTTFHQVEVALWIDVRRLIEKILVDALSSNPIRITQSEAANLLDFYNQMEVAYLHPNSSGIRTILKYSNGNLVRSSLLLRSAQSKQVNR